MRAPSRNAQVLGRMKALGAWREREAQGKNIPRGRIMRDETLADIAGHPPKHQADLAKVRGLSPAWKDNEIGRRLMHELENAGPLPKEEMPDRERRGAPLGREGSLVADLLKLLLKIRAREIDVSARLLARTKSWSRWPPARATCRCCKAGAGTRSARTRWRWSRASWPSPLRTAAC
jgi:ribonuclease D